MSEIKFCCYDILSTGSLITQGPNAGFVYETSDISDILSKGLDCCNEGTWKTCNLFYKLYPPTRSSQRFFRIAWGGGDPRLTTYDNLTYAFNGYGKFIFSRAIDGSFMIQARTKILENVNDTSISGTLFDSFAFKTSDSQIFEIRLNEQDTKYPYLGN